MKINLEFKLQDIWIGVFWKKDLKVTYERLNRSSIRIDVWICLIPMLPLHIRWWKRINE